MWLHLLTTLGLYIFALYYIILRYLSKLGQTIFSSFFLVIVAFPVTWVFLIFTRGEPRLFNIHVQTVYFFAGRGRGRASEVDMGCRWLEWDSLRWLLLCSCSPSPLVAPRSQGFMAGKSLKDVTNHRGRQLLTPSKRTDEQWKKQTNSSASYML